ncbi:MAG: hypothetical protein A2213_08055 [Lysobacterales bacterium RIFOXYA1_FULL_68_6]|nr:MAG: hypothetical protein A2213_08055 [Xanthomonadales bacterium RIFOXYA1_FULL_68_6]
MSETEQAIEFLRSWCNDPATDFRDITIPLGDLRVFLAEHDRLKAELERLTVPQEGSTHKCGPALWWVNDDGPWVPVAVFDRNPYRHVEMQWTPLPAPRQKEAAREQKS